MQRHYYSDPDFGTTEVTERVQRVGWQSKENAEEGSTAMVTIVLDDPDMDLEIVGHRKYFIIEDESEATDNIIFGGFVADQEIGRKGGDWSEPYGRVWTVTLTDANGVFGRRVMVGADCNRPAEHDVARIQWLLGTAEAALFDDVTSFVNTGSPTDMDACDYRGQMFSQIFDDCAQASGKNWWAGFIYDGADRKLTAWYGRDGLAAYESPLRLTNDLGDLVMADVDAGVSDYWPISLDTKLARDPSRVYSGVYLAYDGGAVYRYESTTAAAFAKRDFVAPSLNVKSNAKANARALRYLAELDEQDLRITTSVELPKERVTMLRAGMWVPFKALHLPGMAEFQKMRVLNASVEPISAGERYRVTMELGPLGIGWHPPVYADAFAIIYQPANGAGAWEPDVFWGSTGDAPSPGYAVVPHMGGVDYLVGGQPGYVNEGFVVSGTGDLTVHVRVNMASVFGAGTWTTTVSLRLNGSVVDSSVNVQTWSHVQYVQVTGTLDTVVSVAPGDELTATLTCDCPTFEHVVPVGTGALDLVFSVEGSLAV